MSKYIEKSYVYMGNVGNALLLVSTFLVTFCMLFRWPSTDFFDKNWLENGFCVSNQETFWWNSHALSFFVDTILASVVLVLYLVQPEVPSIQKAHLSGSIMGIFGHGLGHLNLARDPTGMDLRFSLDTVSASSRNTLVTLFALFGIFKGAMPLASLQRLALASTMATVGITLFDISPKMNFVYVQGVIYFFSTIHMLVLSKQHKGTATYMYFPWFNLPVLVVGILESTRCEAFLGSLGGHAVFDSSIAIGTIFIEIMSNAKQSTKDKRE